MKFSVGCECCLQRCLIYKDDFCRPGPADSGVIDIGSNYVVSSGDWMLDNARLAGITDDSIIVYNRDHPEDQIAQKIESQISVTESGGQVRHILGYQDNANYLFSEVEFVNNRCGILRLYSRSGGTNTQLNEDTHFNNLTFNPGCNKYRLKTGYSPSGYLSASLDNPHRYDENWRYISTIEEATVPGNRIGLGVGKLNGGSGLFDRLVYQYHKSDVDVSLERGINSKGAYCPTINIDCVVWGDYFNRRYFPAMSGHLGCNWDVRNGNWQIIDKYLPLYPEFGIIGIPASGSSPTIDNPDFVINKNPGFTDGGLSTTFRSAAIGKIDDGIPGTPHFGDITGIYTASGMYIVDYVDDDNYHFVVVGEHLHTLGPRLVFYKRTAGSNVELDRVDFSKYYIFGSDCIPNILGSFDRYSDLNCETNTTRCTTVKVCLHGTKFSCILAGVSDPVQGPNFFEYGFFTETVAHSGDKVGLGIVAGVPDGFAGNNAYIGFDRASLHESSDETATQQVEDIFDKTDPIIVDMFGVPTEFPNRCVDCDVCQACRSYQEVPSNFSVVINNVQNSGCDVCANFEGTYIVSFEHYTNPNYVIPSGTIYPDDDLYAVPGVCFWGKDDIIAYCDDPYFEQQDRSMKLMICNFGMHELGISPDFNGSGLIQFSFWPTSVSCLGSEIIFRKQVKLNPSGIDCGNLDEDLHHTGGSDEACNWKGATCHITAL